MCGVTDSRKINEILAFWFDASVKDAAEIPKRMSLWFGSDEKTDEEIAGRFAQLVADARDGKLDSWLQVSRGRLALVLLLDQFPRNLFRGKAEAFATDDRALSICEQSISDGRLLEVTPIEQTFLLMPMQHSESKDVQRRSVHEFEQLLSRVDESSHEHFAGFLKYARLHHDIIERFGRFPHRNAILGRTNTEEEHEYLADDAPRFGQR